MFEQKKYKQEIKRCRATIEEIERKRSRSQSALVQAILLQEEPNEADVEWFNKYTGEISACRNHMAEMQKKLDAYMAEKQDKKKKKNYSVPIYAGKERSAVAKDGKNISGSAKPIIFMLCAAGALIMLLAAFYSFGWFTNNKETSGDMAALKATDADFELAAVGESGIYDDYLTAADGISRSNISTGSLFGRISPVSTGSGRASVKWVMSDDSNFGNSSKSGTGIQPGSSGMLTFYVIPNRDLEQLDLTFSLDTVLYTSAAQPNKDNTDCIIDAGEPEAELVKGHILFFRSYDEKTGLYSDMITDTFDFSRQNVKTDTAYRQDIYWVWPYMAAQLILPQDDIGFVGNDHSKLISDEDTAALKKDMAKNPGRYFADSDGDISISEDELNSITGVNSDQYITVNAYWNEADQKIGKKVGYIELQVSNTEQ